MRKTALYCLFGLMLAGWALPAGAAIPWIKDDIDAAEREAKVRKQPLLVYFHTTWCSWCAQMEQKVFSDDAVTEAANAFVALRLNCDRREGQRFMRRFHVSAFPTVLVISPAGDVIGRLGMYRSVPDFLRFLQDCQTPGETLTAIDKKIDAGDHSANLLLRSAQRYYEAAEFEASGKRFEEAIAVTAKAQDEDAVNARIGLAQVKSVQGDSAAALELYRTVLKSYPGSKRLAEAFTGALVILRDEKKSGEIDALFQEFAGRFPEDGAVLTDYAVRLLETGKDPALALQKAARGAELAPDSPESQGALARALLTNNKPAEAMEAVSKAILLSPTDKDLRVLRLEIMEAARVPASEKPPKP